MPLLRHPRAHDALALLLTAALLAAYVLASAWPLGFVLLLPWLHRLDQAKRLRQSAGLGLGLALAWQVGALGWMPEAIARYTGLTLVSAWALWLLAAPLTQAPLLLAAIARHLARPMGAGAMAAATVAAWVAAEWALPRLLHDTLGHGLYPSATLRQGAEWVGTTGLTALLLMVNAAAALAWQRWRCEGHLSRPALALALGLPLAMTGGGQWALASLPDPARPAEHGAPLRVALVQANVADYEALRQQQGTGAVVQQVLDTHEAMSMAAVRGHQADAVLWPETVYPTTLGQPKSPAGAAFDEAVLAFARQLGVPLVLGTFDRDARGEYNSAAFLAPQRGLLGHYRKTTLFPLTESTPAWLAQVPGLSPLPAWLGHWQAGDGARVFPLWLADGREVPVQALICLDALDSAVALAAARQGAQALLTLANDSWFGPDSPGPRLHLAAAAFRSIETRLPQFRAASTGISAVIDASGTVRASGATATRTLVVGSLPVGAPRTTWLVRWGDWVGPAGALALLILWLSAAWPWLWRRLSTAPATESAPATTVAIALLPGPVRWLAAALRWLAGAALVWLGWQVVAGQTALAGNTIAQLRAAALGVVLPWLLAECLRLAWRGELSLPPGTASLRVARAGQAWSVPLTQLQAARPWRCPWPWPGIHLVLDPSGHTQALSFCVADPWALRTALRQAGAPLPPSDTAPLGRSLASRSAAGRPAWAHPLWQWGGLPLLLALPAFHLHQHIAYGSGFGEWQAFGALAFLRSALLWWAAWALAALLCSIALRGVVETTLWLRARLSDAPLQAWRRGLENSAALLLHAMLGGWLLARLLA